MFYSIPSFLAERLLSFLAGLIPVSWTMPKVFLGSPQQGATEQFLSWWHVPVSVQKQRFWEQGGFENCRAELRIAALEVPTQVVKLLWPTIRGPVDRSALHLGEESKTIPIIMRSTVTVNVSGDPVRLPPFLLPAYMARISDENAFIHRTRFTDMPKGNHLVTLRILSGPDTLAERSYNLQVPEIGADNTDFILREIR